VVDYVQYRSERAELTSTGLVGWLGIGWSKYYDWRRRYGRVNEHNGWIPRDFYRRIPKGDLILRKYWEDITLENHLIWSSYLFFRDTV